MIFVALDLETTGLSPQTDTIIEVAAVRFTLTRGDDWRYEATDIEEHSQLVYPGRVMTEEISMITGITDAMLEGKPTWTDVRDKVMHFIGDESVIVGHNVLFDVAMFATHDIDLSSHPILDTFELSEILSQEAESLNLGFLAGMYGLSAGDKEHRALGDTRLSVWLFVHYLNQLETLTEAKKSIFALAREKEKKPNLGLFAEVAGIDMGIPVENGQDFSISLSLHSKWQEQGTQKQILSSSEWQKELITPTSYLLPPTSYTATSLPYGRDAERDFLEKNIHKWTPADIAVFGHHQATYMQELLSELGFSSSLWRSESEFCSIVELRDRITQTSWERKESILIVKLLCWLTESETGLLSELKLYGEERTEITYFRMQSGEENPYYNSLQKELTERDCVIYDMTKNLGNMITPTFQPSNLRTLCLKDITLLEEAIRRAMSVHIAIDEIIAALQVYRDTSDIVSALRWIESLYIGFPDRPTGPNVSPPGDYGETYFLTQAEIWHRGYQTLVQVTQSLITAHRAWQQVRKSDTRRDTILMNKIDTAILTLAQFHTIGGESGVIITIARDALRLSYIPREVRWEIQGFLQQWRTYTLYGTHIDGEKVTKFLANEANIHIKNWEHETSSSISQEIHIDARAIEQLKKKWNMGGTVILTTSMKSVREIGRSLESTGKRILMQGISGGKGKQLSLFVTNTDTSIIVGTIDMWREELELWKSARHIVIAKVPFDPPTDPYFLARTVGMPNNFSLYSEPMAIIKMSTLISRIRSVGYSGVISCEDIRLSETIWWQAIWSEIV
jgi:DNA polymerase III epsilon subunit-like protein